MSFGQAGRAQLERDLAETVAALAEGTAHRGISGDRLETWRLNLEAALAERIGLRGLKPGGHAGGDGGQADGSGPSAGVLQTPTPAEAIVVTDDMTQTTCATCGTALPARNPGPGRPRRFCSGACREAARLRRGRGLAEDWPVRGPRGRANLARIAELAGDAAEPARAYPQPNHAGVFLPQQCEAITLPASEAAEGKAKGSVIPSAEVLVVEAGPGRWLASYSYHLHAGDARDQGSYPWDTDDLAYPDRGSALRSMLGCLTDAMRRVFADREQAERARQPGWRAYERSDPLPVSHAEVREAERITGWATALLAGAQAPKEAVT